jgi:bifunctional DNase/RNase
MKEPPEEARMIDVCLHRNVYRQAGERQYIHLRERDGERSFPIVIGTPEANEIHRVVMRQELARPMTHKLTHNVIQALGARMTHVDIVDLRDNTFHACIVIEGKGGAEPVTIDARPSDAIALALRAGCPIRVAEDVLEQVRTDQAQDKLEEPDEEHGPEAQGPDAPTKGE